MGWPEKIKLTKQLLRSAAEAGYASPTEIQAKIMSRIIGGNDVVAIGPEGCGKTTSYVLSVLNRFNYAPDGVPQVLILVPNQEAVEAVIDRFDTLNRNRSISIVGLYAMPGIESQMDALAEGADIVVATPDRARAIYLKLGLNLNKLQVFIVDDADQIVKQGLQLPTNELAISTPKAQRIVFSEVMHDKLEKMISTFMDEPPVIEVDEIGESTLSLHPQILYQLPNFGTKVNLLNLFMQDEELFTKMVVFANTRQTAAKIYENLKQVNRGSLAIFNSWNPNISGVADIEEFTNSDIRLLIIANENNDEVSLADVPFILHFDLPEDKELYLGRIVNSSENENEEDETVAITFATDIELTQVKRIEQAGGQKMQRMELPDDLVLAKEKKKKEEPETAKKETADGPGAAFHEKKAKNSKTYNYSSGEKAKMNMKKKHG